MNSPPAPGCEWVRGRLGEGERGDEEKHRA